MAPLVGPGTDFGPYYVKERIGSGGYGEVFLAVHRVLRRRTALKVMHSRYSGDPDVTENFMREARIVARFDHPNVVGVYDAGRGDGGHLFMAMRFVPAGSLQDLMEKVKVPPQAQALRIMRDCCAGLAAIHGLGLMHRDIKPANILLEADGRACLTDFGLASLRRERIRGVDDDGMVGGTLCFLAPEQLVGKEVATPRSDLYALGITFTGLATGIVPLEGLGDEEAIQRTLKGWLPDPQALRPDLPADLAALLREMTAKDPDGRPADAGTVQRRIEALLARAEGRRPYAPPEGRAGEREVMAQGMRLERDALVKGILDAYPGPALVLNRHRQIVASSEGAAAALGACDGTSLLGKRPGEAFGCGNADRGPGGCGTGSACAFCGLGDALSQAEQGRDLPIQGDCVIRRACKGEGAFEFAFRLSPLAGIDGDGGPFLLVAFRDVSAERRRRVFEMSFVENLFDAADLVRSVAESSGRAAAARAGGSACRQVGDLLSAASRALAEEALFQQHLLAAESGELQPLYEEVEVHPMLLEIGGLLGRHRAGEGRKVVLRCARGLRLRTDRLLLRRAARNLLRNALEACRPGEQATVEAAALPEGGVEIRIHNPGVMSAEVREQVFKRSFSTKSSEGRGVGLHAARLFIETYLGGQVGFSSGEPGGTTFWIRVPSRTPSTGVSAKGR